MLGSTLAAALRFRILLVGVAAGLIVLGAISLPRVHADAVPELSSGPVLEVQTEALGLSSREVEQYVTVPLENNLLAGIMDVWDVRSHSIPGLSTVDLYFEPGTTELHARQLVEERLTNAFSLPNVSKPPLLIQPLSSAGRVLMIGLSSKSVDPLELSYLARWVVKPKLSGVPGVANVAIFGERDRQIQVLVDPARLAANRVTLNQVITTAGNAQLVSPLSYLEGSSPGTGGFLDGPNQRLEIRPVLPLAGPKDLATVPISDAPGRLPLGAVAAVGQSHQPLIGDAVVGGDSGLVLEVEKLPSASVPVVTRGLERALQDLRPALAGVTIDASFFRPASYVSSSLHNLGIALAIAVVLALLALVGVFLDARAVVVSAASVALSVLIAALTLRALGYTFNALVGLGLLLAIAVVVDDAVGATKEIVARVRERGDRPVEAVLVEACAGLRRTLAFACLIALLLIAPVFFAKGLAARFVHPMLLAFALAVLASMVVAVVFTPALGMLMFSRGVPRRRAASLKGALEAAYGRVLFAVSSMPRNTLGAVCALGFVGLIALPFLGLPSRPALKDRNLVVDWNGPPGASLGEMERVTQRAVGELRALPSVSDAAATLGRAVSADRIVDASAGQIFVGIKSGADYDRAVAAVRATVDGFPGIRASVSAYANQITGGVLAPAGRDTTVRLYGEDYQQLASLARQVEALMARVPGIGRPTVVLPGQEPNIEVAINDAAALRAGALPGDARRQASTLVSGLTVGNFFEHQAVFDVVVWGTPSVRSNADTVRNLLIDTSAGGHVRLGDIASVRVQPEPIDIQHQALSRYLDVTVPVSGGVTGRAGNLIRSELDRLHSPLAYHAELVGGTPEDATSHATFLSYVLAALIGVLLLLQAAFGSFRLAALLALALPSALLGGLLVAAVTGQLGSLGADVGLLAVMVLAVRLGMLQITRTREVQARVGGLLTARIAVEAGTERVTPVLASVAVTAAAMVPFAVIGDVPGTEITHTAAAVILGGLVTATAVCGVLLPALCVRFGPLEPIATNEALEDPVPAPELPVPSG